MRLKIGRRTFRRVWPSCARSVKREAHGWQKVVMGITAARKHPPADWSAPMLVVGLILLLIGIFAHISILTTIGIILLIVGAVFWILGSVGRPIGGRKYWY
jgi:membrane-bound ClpP family serine protease